MKTYQKEIDGKLVVRQANKIVIEKDGMCTYNPTEEMILEDGWVEYVTPEPTEEEKLTREKEHKIREIERFDSSKDVNICYISRLGDTIPYWANKSERSSLKSAVQDCIAMNREYYRLDLREVGVSVEINCEQLLAMLSALEVYAIDCYNKTTDHIFAVNSLTTIEEIWEYDHREGYPEKLTFSL